MNLREVIEDPKYHRHYHVIPGESERCVEWMIGSFRNQNPVAVYFFLNEYHYLLRGKPEGTLWRFPYRKNIVEKLFTS